jgi:hypothetical protein
MKDIGTRTRELVTLEGVTWGHHQGSAIPIPPLKGTHVCALALITSYGLRKAIFDEAKVFVGFECTAVPAGQAGLSF